jgi:Archaeal/vacuolar-type H+-ATPase subunit A
MHIENRRMRTQLSLCGRARSIITTYGAAALAALLAGCGLFDITNPGPIQDEALDTPAAGKTVLVGLVSDIEVALSEASYYAGVASTDLTADATQEWVQNMGSGRLLADESSYIWDPAQAARWSAEAGIARLLTTQSDAATSPLVAAAYLWAGYANRILGDVACVAVFDGGAPGPGDDYYRRAIEHFETSRDMAQAIGTSMDSVRLAAIAGLAQSHLILGNLTEAADYAALIPDNFTWVAHRSGNSPREYNRVWEATVLSTQATVYGTYSDTLGASGDPRTPWVDLEKTGSSGIMPYYQQAKYATRDVDVALAKGAEMRLIEAEVLLEGHDMPGAVALINHVRGMAGMGIVAASNEAAAWVALDRERHLTLWLEGRRLKDNARLAKPGRSSWSAGYMAGRDTCFPASLTERSANPSLNIGA